MPFKKWIEKFLDEKGIELDEYLDVKRPDGHTQTMPIGFIVEHIKAAPKRERDAIKTMLVKIDFHNVSVRDYLTHLGQALWNEFDSYVAVV